ncbi:MAG: ExbD/TolR family protein [Gammaproteobacteria bacterium]|jgi:biopolymer transport protein TolR|nr:ExbD/TolR family protein [Gammaproteobacteria bacterium]MDP6534924.1 ExbD/TolR family protein [Gammaproteobacteria bacterium]MDP6732001.1 ExbD/TolR family protein [Gammaproteobacteria bacterium]|tara:strand:+ start:803 stop:1243 length:441 start_codon:yes stop_codon:yes gene_type:complete
METMVRKKRKPMSEINVVPYIDVMLVLLIVFMVTAPMLNQGIDVDLPQANNEPLDIDENLETLVVSVTSNDEYFLSIGATGDERESMTLETVGQRVSQIKNANPSIQILIEGDAGANWQAMITLITTLNQAGVDNPNFITQPLNSI